MTKWILSLLFFPQVVWAGGAVGNGGDTIYCVAGSESPYVGYYNLDYLANRIAETQYSNEFDTLLKPEQDEVAQIATLLRSLEVDYPMLARSLKVYSDSFYNNSVSAPYSWLKAPYGVKDVDDENLRLLLPKNCIENGREKPFIQTVVRNEKELQVEFTYSTQVMKQLPPLQQSFLLLHEWLWNFTEDPQTVRNANAILHSHNWNPQTAAAKVNELFFAGLDFRRAGMSVGEVTISFLEDCFGSSQLCADQGDIFNGIPDESLFMRVNFFNRSEHLIHVVPERSNKMALGILALAPGEKFTHFFGRKAAGGLNKFCVFYSNLNGTKPESLDCDSKSPEPQYRFGLD